MPKFDAFIIKSQEYLVKGIEAENVSQILNKKGLAKDELFKLSQPEKYGKLTGEETEIVEVEYSDEDE